LQRHDECHARLVTFYYGFYNYNPRSQAFSKKTKTRLAMFPPKIQKTKRMKELG
jgi:hypothetical protein